MTNSPASGAYKGTKIACYTGYIVQAIVANLAPLLFITFNRTFDISLTKITFLSGFNFAVQLLVDLIAARYAERLGYRKSVILSQIFAAAGMIGYGTLPYLLGNRFAGLLIATALCADGGACQPDSRVLPLRQQIRLHEPASLLLLLGAGGGRSAQHAVFHGMRHRQLADPHCYMGGCADSQCLHVYKGPGSTARGGGCGDECEAAVFKPRLRDPDTSHDMLRRG